MKNLCAVLLISVAGARLVAAQIPSPTYSPQSTSTQYHSVVCQNRLKLVSASGYPGGPEHRYEFDGQCSLANITKVSKSTKTNFGTVDNGTSASMITVALVNVVATATWNAQTQRLDEAIKVMGSQYAGESKMELKCPQDPIVVGVACTGTQFKNTTSWDGFDYLWAVKQPVLARMTTPAVAAAFSASQPPKPSAPPPPPDPIGPKPGINAAVVGAVLGGSQVIELEGIISTAQRSEGPLGPQNMSSYWGGWGGGQQLLWAPKQVGAQLALKPLVAAAGRYHLTLFYTKAPDYGSVQVSVDGQPVAGYDGYDARVRLAQIDIGVLDLAAGPHQMLVAITGQNPLSKGSLVGLDRIELERVTARNP